MRILIADDEKDLNQILAQKLKQESYSVDCCFDGEEALDYLESAEYDVAILDIMMPKKTGLEVLQTIRENGNPLPILLLTARDSIDDRVLGLDLGADDYLVKPFALEELLARLRVLLRKTSTQKNNVLQAGNLSLHLDSHQVKRGNREIQLSSKEFSLLLYMMQNKGIVLSRDTLEQHIYSFDFSGGSNVIDVYIRYLRRKIDDGEDEKLIHTIRGQGYVLRDPS